MDVMTQRQKEALWKLRRWNLVRGAGCPKANLNEQVLNELMTQRWAECDPSRPLVYVTNAGLEAVKVAEAPLRRDYTCEGCGTFVEVNPGYDPETKIHYIEVVSCCPTCGSVTDL